jgi:hypothetical protein
MTQRKKWREVTTGQQKANQFGAVMQVTLLPAALWDMWHRPADEINGDRRSRLRVQRIIVCASWHMFCDGDVPHPPATERSGSAILRAAIPQRIA